MIRRRARRLWLVALVACSIACRSVPAVAGEPMPSPAAEPPRLLTFSDAELFAPDFKQLSRDASWKLSDDPVDGLDLQAPPTVDTKKQAMLPVALLQAGDGVRQWNVNTEVNSILVAVDLVDGSVRAANMHPTKKRYDPGERPKSREGALLDDAKSVRSVAVNRFDAHQLLDLPWHAGRVALTVLQQDWRSNAVQVELTGGDPTPPKELQLTVEQAKELADRRAADTLPTYAKRPDSPALPNDGVALAITAKAGGPIVAAGSLRLKPPARTMLTKDLRDWIAAKMPKSPVPAALVTVTLLVLVHDDPVAKKLDVQVPVYEPKDGVAEAHFATDLRAASREPIPSGDHTVWAIVADRIHGPFALTVP
jgi:hypothetical protein